MMNNSSNGNGHGAGFHSNGNGKGGGGNNVIAETAPLVVVNNSSSSSSATAGADANNNGGEDWDLLLSPAARLKRIKRLIELPLTNSRPADVSDALPFNHEAEEAVIGSLLLDGEVMLQVRKILTADDFFDKGCAIIYGAILAITDEHTPTDMTLIRDALKTTGRLGDGDNQVKPTYLVELLRTTSTPVYAVYYARLVKEASLKRALITGGTQITALGFNHQDKMTGEKLMDEAMSILQDLRRQVKETRVDPRYTSHEQMADSDAFLNSPTRQEALAERELMRTNPDAKRLRPTIVTGFPTLDGYIDEWGGYRAPKVRIMRKRMTIIVMDTSVGKTSLMLQIAALNAFHGVKVLYLYNELDKEEFQRRVYCQFSNPQVPYMKLLDYDNGMLDLSPAEIEATHVVGRRISAFQGKLEYYCITDKDDRETRAVVEDLQATEIQKTGIGFQLVFCDYAASMDLTKGRNTAGLNEVGIRNEQIKNMSNMAQELDIAFVWAQQLRKEYTQDGELFIRPTRSIVRDSKFYVDKSNVCIFGWRRGSPDPVTGLDEGYFEVVKNTSGPLLIGENRVRVEYCGERFEWAELGFNTPGIMHGI